MKNNLIFFKNHTFKQKSHFYFGENGTLSVKNHMILCEKSLILDTFKRFWVCQASTFEANETIFRLDQI